MDAPSRRSAAPFFSQGAGAGADFLHQRTKDRSAPAQHQQLPGYGQTSQPASGYGQASAGLPATSQLPPSYAEAIKGLPASSPPPPQAGSYLDNLNNFPHSSIEPPQELNPDQRQINQERNHGQHGHIESGWLGKNCSPASSSGPSSATLAPNFPLPTPPSSGYTQWTQQLDAPPARSAASGSAAAFFSRRPVPGASFLHYNDPKARSE